jgi:hypothetical protein
MESKSALGTGSGSGAKGPKGDEESKETTDSGNEIGEGSLKSESGTEEGEIKSLVFRVTIVETGMGDSDGESERGEKEPGMECQMRVD